MPAKPAQNRRTDLLLEYWESLALRTTGAPAPVTGTGVVQLSCSLITKPQRIQDDDEVTELGGHRISSTREPIVTYPPPYQQPVPVAYAAVPVQMVRPTSSSSVAAMVLGIISILGGALILGLPAIAAVVLGHMGLKDTQNEAKAGRGMAITGLVLGYVCLVPAAFFFVMMIVGAAASTTL
ncbi:hypothetical protein GCM10010112_19690 [Actinoplanes lobatus]|uniref:DUF4190 domain-containing protein n=1 Tax=Actinoplanes lobatus TaxID=113568 RepID=A0A7W7HPC6_9ACTN|nr:DUF4190 domain-containing protein [Actinoplanes lobatus]MBB4754226.1 hypothetical protein [Actinoplanes lobatus]GGN61961.1 hypothetical protein GCM10010112_19690 [Actinoplanes lobatus]GIE44897.1 hypothetical protein Alo02nite_77950 [Actinoplanes lobatus]